MPHESRPWNPIIANVFYRAGIIERWGMGTLNVIDWCVANGNPAPTWSEQAGSVYVTFWPVTAEAVAGPPPQVAPHVTEGVGGREVHDEAHEAQVAPQVTPQVTPQVERLLAACEGEQPREELQDRIGLSDRKHFRTEYLHPALAGGLIEMTIPEKPRSKNQRYRLTEKGRQTLAKTPKVSPDERNRT